MAENDHRAFYSAEAVRYEATRYGSRYGRLFRLLHRDAVQRVLASVPFRSRILDVASGTGELLPVLATEGSLVVASDLTPAMLVEARRQRFSDSSIVYCVGDALRLPYPDSSFDVVTSSRFLHLFEPAAQLTLLKEMARVLRSGGTLIVDFYSADARRRLWLPIAVYRALLRKRAENDYRVAVHEAMQMIKSCDLRALSVFGLGNFLLAPFFWIPLNWRIIIGEWLGRHCVSLSEQFLVTAIKP
jgi:ubiquinone/menaquinone biosynthesis C-methylase UbiE